MTQPMKTSKPAGPLIIAGLVLLLLILHQDNWFWTDATLVFGFIPIAAFLACLHFSGGGRYLVFGDMHRMASAR